MDKDLVRLNREIDKLKKKVRESISAGVSLSADAVKKEIRNRAPSDTGELRDSIKTAKNGTVVSVYSDSDHAGFVEFGTSKMAAKPFFRPAIDTSKSAFFSTMKKTIQDAIHDN